MIGPIIRGMILNINLMQNYSDNTVTAKSSSLSPTGCGKKGWGKRGGEKGVGKKGCGKRGGEKGVGNINNKWKNMRNKHVTKRDTNNDVDLDNCVVHTVR